MQCIMRKERQMRLDKFCCEIVEAEEILFVHVYTWEPLALQLTHLASSPSLRVIVQANLFIVKREF